MIRVALLFDPQNNWIQYYYPKCLNNFSHFEFQKVERAEEVSDFDIVFVLGYTKILDEKFLKSTDRAFTVHESDLPDGKGFAPVQWQVLEGKKQITVSLLKLSKDVDSGDIYEQTKLRLDGTELYDQIREKQAQATFAVIKKFLQNLSNHRPVRQEGQGTFYPRRQPSDSQLDLDKSIREQFPLLRICNNENWPAYFVLDGVKYILKIYKDG